MFEIVIRLLLGTNKKEPEREPESRAEISYWARRAPHAKTNSLLTHYRDMTRKDLR